MRANASHQPGMHSRKAAAHHRRSHHDICSNSCCRCCRNPGAHRKPAPASRTARLLSDPPRKRKTPMAQATGVDGGPEAHAVGSWRAELDVTPAIGQRIAPENHRRCSRTASRVGAHHRVGNTSLSRTHGDAPVHFFNRIPGTHSLSDRPLHHHFCLKNLF